MHNAETPILGVNNGIPWDPRLSEIRAKIFEQ